MDYDNKRVAGLLFIVAVVQYALAIVFSEAVYSGYSVGQQMVSELGDWSLAGNNAAIFNVSIILYGLLVIVGAYYIQRVFKNRLFASLLAINGIGSLVAGVVALNISFEVHGMFGLVAFVAMVASAIMSYKFVKSPLSYISVILGVVTLSALVLFLLGQGNSDFLLGLGLGGIERFIIYPMMLWLLGFGSYLIGQSSDTVTTSKA
ncbi:MAG TPA: DUF998 domain-containing protein [Acidobacteriota bacterium]|nr:DUF998 domain-containing protein [Acidobacteriota bacterium]